MSLERSALAALASPRRREILRIVWAEERTAGAIHEAMPDVTFGAVSLQLKALVQAGLLESRAEQTRRYYRARREVLAPLAGMLEEMWADALWSLKLAAELEQTRRGPRPQARHQFEPSGDARNMSRNYGNARRAEGAKDGSSKRKKS